LNGVRHSEMNLIAKTSINWNAKTVRIRQGKTGNYKVIGPLGHNQSRYFASSSINPRGFGLLRSGNINRSFTEFSGRPAERARVPTTENPNGLVLHDAEHTATTHLLEM